MYIFLYITTGFIEGKEVLLCHRFDYTILGSYLEMDLLHDLTTMWMYFHRQ